jgi:hypothetical protein
MIKGKIFEIEEADIMGKHYRLSISPRANGGEEFSITGAKSIFLELREELKKVSQE